MKPQRRSAEPDRIRLGALAQSPGFVLRIAQLTMFERFFAAFGDGELRLSEYTVLYAIAQNPNVRQGALADVLKIKWSNMTKLVRALEGRGLVERHVPADDRRSVRLRLTAEGRAGIAATEGQVARADQAALAMLDEGEQALLLRLSRKIAGWPTSGRHPGQLSGARATR